MDTTRGVQCMLMKLHDFSENDFSAVEFKNNSHPRIKIEPMYFKLGFSPTPKIYGREAVLNGLVNALALLPIQYGFLIWDVYRPRDVQGKLFKWLQEEFRTKYPHFSEEDIYKETLNYISLPSKIGDEYCSPHLSGGAIDLTLLDMNTGKEVDMGTLFDDFSERAHCNYFDLKEKLSPEESKIKESRSLLHSVMRDVGFTSYDYEWWHFDLGNSFWADQLQKPAVFGPLFGDLEWPKDCY